MKQILIVVSIIFVNTLLFSQQGNIPAGFFFQQNIAFEINKSVEPIHTGFKPLLKSELLLTVDVDSVLYIRFLTGKLFDKYGSSLIIKKVLYEDFIRIEKDRFKLYVNPVFYLEKGNTSDTLNYFINTRAIEIKGDIGEKLSFYSGFRENQARYRSYIYDRVRDRLVAPGQGAVKLNNSDLSLFDFSSSSAYLSWTPFKFINLQIGQDKHFIGDGYRSLLLSDYASNYPFAKIGLNYKAFKYTILFTEFRDFQISYYDYHFKKHGAFNYLSYRLGNRFEIGLFEGMIYKTTDTTEDYINRFKADYFIPVPGLRAGINGFSGDNHLLLGMNAKLKAHEYIQFYGQAALDDPSQRKYSYQGGVRIFDVLFSKGNGHQLYVQSEYNHVSPRCYSHRDKQLQTWSHYNEELAHPAGSDLSEIFANVHYSYQRLYADFRFNSLTLNRSGSYSDIFITDNENYTYYPEPVFVKHYTATAGFIINPASALQLYIGYDRRESKSEGINTKENFLMFGIKSDISNFYYDY